MSMIIVSGAGTTAVNQNYTDCGLTHDGKPLYRSDDALWCLFYNTDYGGKWWIAQYAAGAPVFPPAYYYVNSSNDVPPATGWFVVESHGESPAPTLTLDGGTVSIPIIGFPVTVKMTDSTDGAEVHYTTDGSTPTRDSPTYAGPFTLTAPPGTVLTIKALAVKEGMLDSAVKTLTVTI